MSRAADLLQRIIDEGFRPNWKGIVDSANSGMIPIVFFELGNVGLEFAKMFEGWKPGVQLLGVLREDFARTVGQSDPVTAPWATRPRPEGDIPIFLIIQNGSLLVNYVVNQEGKGVFSLEPGSTDAELRARPFS